MYKDVCLAWTADVRRVDWGLCVNVLNVALLYITWSAVVFIVFIANVLRVTDVTEGAQAAFQGTSCSSFSQTWQA